MSASAFFSSSQMTARFTLSGRGTGYGDLRIEDLFIPAFGPQTSPLHDPKQFGLAQKLIFDDVIQNSSQVDLSKDPCSLQKKDHSQMQTTLSGWSCCYGEKTTWVHLNASVAANRIYLSLLGIGNDLLKLVFYIQAKKCAFEDGAILFPGELKKYEGHPSKIILNDRVFFHCKENNKTQVIPLSGSKCFWDSTFLIAIDFVKARSLFNIINLEILLNSSI